jgi:hypothetical protein
MTLRLSTRSRPRFDLAALVKGHGAWSFEIHPRFLADKVSRLKLQKRFKVS